MTRILHLLNGLEVGGKERVVMRLSERAQRDGLDVELVLFDTSFRDSERDLDPAGVPVHFLPRKQGLDLSYASRLAKLVLDRDATVVHAHNDTAVFYASIAGPWVRRRPLKVIGTFHTLPGHDTPWARRLTKAAASFAHQLTAVSTDLASRLMRDGWVRRCRTLANGVDLNAFSPQGGDDGWRARCGVAEGEHLVGHVGRFDPIKRHQDLIDAADEWARRIPRTKLCLVGQGPNRDEMRERSRRNDAIQFESRIVEMAPFYRALDLFVICSDHECAPLVLLEAMASGCAIVATNVGGVGEILAGPEGECGVLVPPRDVDALARSVAELLSDDDRRRKLGAMAMRRAAAFSADREWGEYRKIYGL